MLVIPSVVFFFSSRSTKPKPCSFPVPPLGSQLLYEMRLEGGPFGLSAATLDVALSSGREQLQGFSETRAFGKAEGQKGTGERGREEFCQRLS